jgi:putative transport protein
LLGTLGLLFFLYGIGIQYGAQFFRGLTSREGVKANAAACIGVIIAGLVSCGFIPFGITLADALGMFAGSGTSTASLQVAIASMKSNDAAVAYSVAYPCRTDSVSLYAEHWAESKDPEAAGEDT